MKATAKVAIVVVAFIAIGVAVVGGLPVGPPAIQNAVVQVETRYLVPPGSPPPTVSFVVTTPRSAYRYLTAISWSTGFYSTRDCRCHASRQSLTGSAGTTSAALQLIKEEPGPVAVVELSGDKFLLDERRLMVSWGPACIAPCHRRPWPVFEADTAFIVVNLADGQTTGGMIATPEGHQTSFSLASLGPVTSWVGPTAFGSPYPGRTRIVQVDSPHQTGW